MLRNFLKYNINGTYKLSGEKGKEFFNSKSH